jgi:hypothetical protein
MIADINQKSPMSDAQIEAKELCNVIAKSEKISQGHMQLPES